MNIGIDIDDTITDTYETLIPMVAISYGINIDKFMKKLPSYKELVPSGFRFRQLQGNRHFQMNQY